MKLLFTLILSIAVVLPAHADVMKDFDGLGDNKELFDKAKALHPEMEVTVVQKRIVERRNRFEVAPEFATYVAGDAYTNTYGYGLNGHFHITPRWSIGAKYTYFTNKLNEEGLNLIKEGNIPDVDFPKSNLIGMLNFYPIYGKMNMFGLGITHFDVYGSLGAGSIELRSGNSVVLNAGAGIGFWWSQHFTSRFEVRYQTYEALRIDGPVDINNMIVSLQMGYLL
jgi:outer membrane beta-barrel protein